MHIVAYIISMYVSYKFNIWNFDAIRQQITTSSATQSMSVNLAHISKDAFLIQHYWQKTLLAKNTTCTSATSSLHLINLLTLHLAAATSGEHHLPQEHKNLKCYREGNIWSENVGLGNPSRHDVSIQSKKIVSPSLCCCRSGINEDWEPVKKLADGLWPAEQTCK